MEIARNTSNRNGARLAFPNHPDTTPTAAAKPADPAAPAPAEGPLSHPPRRLSDMEIARNTSNESGTRLAFGDHSDTVPAAATPTDPAAAAAARGALSHPPHKFSDMEIARNTSDRDGARLAFGDHSDTVPAAATPTDPAAARGALSHPPHKFSDMEIARNTSDRSGARLAFGDHSDTVPAAATPTDSAAARGALSHPSRRLSDMEIARNTSDRDGARLAFGEPAVVPVAGAGDGAAAGGSSRGVVSRVWAAVAALFTSPVDLLALTDVGLEKHLGLLARAKSRLAALEAAAVAELARRRGDKAAADVVAAIVREPRGGARRAVKHAKQLAKVAKTADALADGSISPQQAKKIAEAADDTPIDEDFLITTAKEGEPDAFNGAVRRHVNERNRGETLAARRRRQHKRRYAHIREETDGMFTLHAEFDPISGRQVAAEISTRSDHLWRHEDAGDRATPEQRRADALADLITNSSTGRRGTPSVGIMIHADVDLTAQALANTLTSTETANSTTADAAADPVRDNGANAANPSAEEARAAEATGKDAPRFASPADIERNGASPGNRTRFNANTCDSDSEWLRPAGATGSPNGPTPGTVPPGTVAGGGAASGSPPGGPGFAWRLVNPRLDDGTPLGDEEFLAWACDALLLPAVFRGKTQPLWLGRGKRYPTKALRDILEARDGGCAGCDKSVYWCQAHHIIHWAHGGPTDLDNLVLLCNYCHHHKIHALGYTVIVRPDGKYALQAPTDTRDPDNNSTRGPDSGTRSDENGSTGDSHTVACDPDHLLTVRIADGARAHSSGTGDPIGDTLPDDRGTRDPAGARPDHNGTRGSDSATRRDDRGTRDPENGGTGDADTVACDPEHSLTVRIADGTGDPHSSTRPDDRGTGDLTAGAARPDYNGARYAAAGANHRKNASTGDADTVAHPDNASTGDPTGGTRPDDSSARYPAAGANHRKNASTGDADTVAHPDNSRIRYPAAGANHRKNGSTGNPAGGTRPDNSNTRDPDSASTGDPTGGTRPDNSSTGNPTGGTLGAAGAGPDTHLSFGSAGGSNTVACHSGHALTIRIPRTEPLDVPGVPGVPGVPLRSWRHAPGPDPPSGRVGGRCRSAPPLSAVFTQ